MLPANTLGFGVKSSDKLPIYIRNNNGLRTEPWETRPSASAHEQCWPFNIILYFLAFKKFIKEFKKLPVILFR